MDFSSMQELLERLKLIASFFPEGAEFSAYLTSQQGESFYGLDYEELAEKYEQFRGEVKSISTSCSGPNGRTVNLRFRFAKESEQAEGQYAIAGSSSFQNHQFDQMLRGEWQPLTEEDHDRYRMISKLLGLVKEYKEVEEEIAREEAQARRKIGRNGQNTPARQPFVNNPLTTIKERFEFDPGVPTHVLVQLLEDLSTEFLEDAPFNIRLITSDGEPYSDIGTRGLVRFFERRRGLVHKVMMDAATPQGELVDMVLLFGPQAPRLNAEVEVTSGRAKDIQRVIRQQLLAEVRDFPQQPPRAQTQAQESNRPPSGKPAMIHEMFRFDEEYFSLDKVLRLLTHISSRFLQKAAPSVFLSTTQGKTYPALTTRQLRAVFKHHQRDVSFLLFGMNQARTGQTFSLMFQFQAPGHEAYGSLSMMWGTHDTHALIKAMIWEELRLRSYRSNEGPQISVSKAAPPVELEGDQMLVDPVFQGRGFEIDRKQIMIVMPLEAYWSDPLWEFLDEKLRQTNRGGLRAKALFSEDVLEETWASINESHTIIADLTYKHPDVFYKIGIAQTLGKYIILITQHARDIPHDFRHFPHIVYDNNAEGLQKLEVALIRLLAEAS
ncbi:MAG: hypothetical protein AAF206_17565 [Bacteroidota bacterium]